MTTLAARRIRDDLPPAIEIGAGLRIAGYASLFGDVDLGRDLVERGAFAAALRRKGVAGIRMLFQHDPAEPVGVWTSMREDERGLAVEGRLEPASARARELAGLIRAGAVDGLSIGFKTVRAASDPVRRVRRIVEADLWEVSIVTFPMLPGARIERDDRVRAAEPRDVVRAMEAATRMIEAKEQRA